MRNWLHCVLKPIGATQEVIQVKEQHQSEINTLTAAHTEQLSAQSAGFEEQLADLHATHQQNLSQSEQTLDRMGDEASAICERTHQYAGFSSETQGSLEQQQQENHLLQERLTQLQSQIDTDAERNQLQESEQVASLTDELQQVRKEVVERQETVDTLRDQLDNRARRTGAHANG